MAVVREHFSGTTEEIRDAILAAVGAFTGNAAATDDQTLLVNRKTEVF